MLALPPPRPEPSPPARVDRSWWWLAAAAVALAVAAFALDATFDEGVSLRAYGERIEATLHAHEAEVEAIADDTAFLQRQVYGLGRLHARDKQADADAILALSQRPYNVCLYERDSLLFWTSNRVFLPEATPASRLANSGLRKLKNGSYLIRRRRIDLFRGRSFDLVALIPVYDRYTLSSEYLRAGFTGNPDVPDAVELADAPTAFPIRARFGQVLGYLHASRRFHDRAYQAGSLALLLAGCVLLAFAASLAESRLRGRYGALASAGAMGGAVVLARWGLGRVDWTERFDDLGLVSRVLEVPVLTGSLGGFVADVLLGLWLVTLFHRHYRHYVGLEHSQWRRYLTTGAHYLAIVATAYALAYAFESVVTDSALEFDFNNVLNLDTISVIAVIALLVLMLGTFLLAHRLMLSIEEIGLSKGERLAALLTAMTATVPLAHALGGPLPLPHFYVGTLVFVVVYDMFVDSGESNVLWLFFWLVVIAMYAAALLFTFNEQKDLARRVAYAEALSQPRDSTAEEHLGRLVATLRGDIPFQEALASTDTLVSLRDVAPSIERRLVDEGYLYNNYGYRVYGYESTADTTFLLGRDPREARAVHRRWNEGFVASPHVRFTLPTGKGLSYVVRLRSDLVRGSSRDLYLEFEHAPRAPSRVFTELLVDERYRHLAALPGYDYAVYRHGVLIEESGSSHATELSATDAVPAPGYWRAATDSRYSTVMYASTDGHTHVVLGKDMGGYWRPMSLFSYLFVWCILLTLVLSLANTYVDFLPRAVDVTWLGKPDLKTKIQVGIIALVLLSFAMIGYVTVLYFHNSADTFHDARLNRKVASILRNTEHEINLIAELTSVDRASLRRIIKPISEIHSMDVNLYDLDGDLISSSEADIYERGVIAPKMGAYAYQMMAKRGRSQVVQAESVGSLAYRTAYVPVRMPEGDVAAFMGLPYYTKERDLREDVSEFMGTLLNVYVFLLLIAGAIAITVANSITRPLSELGAKIRRFKVDGGFEPLSWPARDELGVLIGEFNTMLTTVEENAVELDNARRDKAWREMAQQVAHEIKNPLTPMKLSAQHMRNVFARDPERARPIIERTLSTLIEQIDGLDSIASNFSTFARMPEPEPAYFDLREVVVSVHHLFREGAVEARLDAAERLDLVVFADKKLVTRVLTNLMKNAIQAIPDGRPGVVAIALEREGGLARVAVRDNGTGIPVEMRDKVFAPKFTTKSSGSGLGLAMCRDIAKASRGRIWFETETGSGTTFYFEVPIADVEEVVEALHGG